MGHVRQYPVPCDLPSASCASVAPEPAGLSDVSSRIRLCCFVSTDQFRIERNACSLGLLPGFSLECAVSDPLLLGPVPSRYRAYRKGVVTGDRLKDGDHTEFCA